MVAVMIGYVFMILNTQASFFNLFLTQPLLISGSAFFIPISPHIWYRPGQAATAARLHNRLAIKTDVSEDLGSYAH